MYDFFFFFKQKTAYEMSVSDWSSDVCSSDLDLRVRYGRDAAVYAGGTELLMAMKLGLARWPHLIDVKTIAALRGVRPSDSHVTIGATTTHWELERDATIRRAIPAFARLEANVAN